MMDSTPDSLGLVGTDVGRGNSEHFCNLIDTDYHNRKFFYTQEDAKSSLPSMQINESCYEY